MRLQFLKMTRIEIIRRPRKGAVVGCTSLYAHAITKKLLIYNFTANKNTVLEAKIPRHEVFPVPRPSLKPYGPKCQTLNQKKEIQQAKTLHTARLEVEV